MDFSKIAKYISFCILSLILSQLKAQRYFESEGRRYVKDLSSKHMNGRGYYKRGDYSAAQYIVNQLERFNLKSIDSLGFLQPYRVKVNYFPQKIKFSINGKSWKPGVDFLCDAANPSLSGTFPIIPIQRYDFLFYESLHAYLSQLNGCSIYIDNSHKKDEPAEIQKIIDHNLQYFYQDTTLPQKAILLYSPEKLTWTVLNYQNPKSVFQLHKRIPMDAYQSLQIEQTTKLDTAYATQNIMAKVTGLENTDSFVVFSAHYDHLGRMGKSALFPGANDNASGTAMLLTLADYFSKHPLRYNILFFFFSGEELGLKGSEYLTQHSPIDLHKIKFLMNLDMAGTGQNGIQIVNGTKYSNDFEEMVHLNDSLHLVKQVLPRGETHNSDHYWFDAHGVPSFFIYTLGGVNYHDVNDTYVSLPFTAFDGYARLLIDFIRWKTL